MTHKYDGFVPYSQRKHRSFSKIGWPSVPGPASEPKKSHWHTFWWLLLIFGAFMAIPALVFGADKPQQCDNLTTITHVMEMPPGAPPIKARALHPDELAVFVNAWKKRGILFFDETDITAEAYLFNDPQPWVIVVFFSRGCAGPQWEGRPEMFYYILKSMGDPT